MSDLDPARVVASFDSASVLHAATAAALRGEPFPRLGNNRLVGRAVRIGGRLPWPILKRLYSRIGAAEGLDPDRLGDVDLSAVADSFAAEYPQRRWPAVLLGPSNGALTHLAAAMQAPWLPGTVLVPVAHTGDPDRAVDALHFGESAAPALLERNPDITLHQMHDPAQDELMAARMARSERHSEADIFVFQHGVSSPGIATSQEWLAVARRHGINARLAGLRPNQSPHDIGSLARYSVAFDSMPRATQPWSPLDVEWRCRDWPQLDWMSDARHPQALTELTGSGTRWHSRERCR
jgi:hypothetical protein